MRRALYIALAILGILLTLVLGLFGLLQTGFARDQMRQWIADATAGSATHVQVAAIEGLVPFDMRLTGVRISDRDGHWLSADRIAVAWSPADLIAGRLRIDEVAAGTIELTRLPVSGEPQATEPGPLIPELPVAIDIRRLAVERLALAAPILGQPAALSLEAKALLGAIGDEWSASLAVRQLAGQTGTATIDLAYQPEQDFLKLAGKIEEPQGGVLGRLAGLPAGSDLRVALDGEGPLEAWQGRLNATLDGSALLDAMAEIKGREHRAISFTLRGEPGAILPEKIRPMLAGGVEATGAFTLAPDRRTLAVSALSAKTAAGSVTASGVLGLSAPGDLAVTATLGDSKPFATLVPDVTWSAASIQARVLGEIAMPRVTAEATVRDLAAADLRIGASNVTVDASAAQGFAHPIGIRTDVRLSGVTAANPRFASLLADGLQLSFAGSADQAGTVVADQLDLRAGAVRLTGAGRAEQWGAVARSAQAKLTVTDLASVGAPMGLPGTGAAEISLTLAPGVTGERLVVDGTGQGFSIGQPIVDRLLGQTPRVQLALEGTLPRAMKITTAQVVGTKARMDVQGALADRSLDLSFTGTLDDAAAIDPALGGKAMIDGTIYGTLDQPSLVAELNAPALTFAGHRADNLKISASGRDLLTTPVFELEGAAGLDGLPATVTTSVAVEDARIAAPDLVVTLGKSRLAGDIALINALLAGDLALDLPDLSEVGRVAGPAMRGTLSATLALDAANGRQNATVTATGQRILVADDLNVPGLELKATVGDLFGAPTISADVNMTDPVIGGHALSEVSLNAEGPLAGLQTKISLSGPDLKAAAEAAVARLDTGYRIELQTLTADVKDVHVQSARPATIEILEQETRITDLALAVEDGMLGLSGSVSPADMTLAATIESLPLAIARAFAPDLSLKGRIDGKVEIAGTPAAPSGRFTIAGKNIGASDAPGQQADIDVTGTLQQGRLDIKGTARPKAGGELAFTAVTTSLASDARVEARANGTLDLALVDAFLAGGADRVAGKATLDLAATGALAAPEVRGTLTLSDAGYENLRYGIKLRAIAAEVRADGPVVQVVSLSATTPGGGQVSGEGVVDLRNGVAPDLKIRTRGATIIDTDLANATVDSDLVIGGNLQSRLSLGGAVKILKAEIRVPDKLPPSVQEIEVIEINASPQVAARIAARAPPLRQSVIMDLDLAVNAPQQLAVRGHGLDVELGGTIHVGGTTSAPDVDGAFKLRHGTLDIAGKRLEFTKGQLTFEGGEQIDPILDLTAVAHAETTQVTARVEGSARAPRITLSSVPTLPEDEILARLLFGKSAGALSPFELLQLAQATAELAGVNTGPGVLDKLRKSTGLDRLSLEQQEGAPGPSLGAGRYVAEGVYVGVSQGANAASGTATVEIEVTPNIKVESEIGANAAGKAGVNLEWDY